MRRLARFTRCLPSPLPPCSRFPANGVHSLAGAEGDHRAHPSCLQKLHETLVKLRLWLPGLESNQQDSGVGAGRKDHNRINDLRRVSRDKITTRYTPARSPGKHWGKHLRVADARCGRKRAVEGRRSRSTEIRRRGDDGREGASYGEFRCQWFAGEIKRGSGASRNSSRISQSVHRLSCSESTQTSPNERSSTSTCGMHHNRWPELLAAGVGAQPHRSPTR